jgi:hypothetical protein
MIRSPWAIGLAAMLIIAAGPGFAVAQDEPETPDDGPKAEAGEGKKDAPKPKNGVKPYDEVITEDATTDPGLFLVHRVDGKVFYEIPTDALDVPMLWVTQIAQTSKGRDIMGTLGDDLVVRWEYREADEKVLLREVRFRMRAEEDDAIAGAVEASSLSPIIMGFSVAAYGKDKAPVVEVTELFTSDVPELSVKDRLGAERPDPKRTFVDQIKSFPENIEVKVLTTYNPRSARGGDGPMASFGGGGDGSITALIHHSMVKLPDDPMEPREYDDRVGYFTVGFEDYSSDEHEVDEVRYITRWRLEKKDPEAEVSDPVEPIVFYIGREVPETWRPFVRQGIEAWQGAFEEAGFSNAILAKDAPDPRQDPDWDAEDARYSSIRWLPTDVQNAMGPHVHDPRTGEILESDIQMYHNVIKLCRDWYFVQASPNDERAQDLPLPDDLMGELIAYVVSHEVGHTLGFPHNMKASSSYTVEELRSEEFTEKYGTEASIMDYGRFNYVAQPGDGARLIPIIGPYDDFAVEWGYRQFAGDEAEEEGLAALVKKQLDDPKLRFGDPNPSEDPSQQTEDLGSDPVLATELGLKNLERVAGFLVEATSEEGENYDLLRNMYDQLVGQFRRETGHVANVVGGFYRNNAWYGDADTQFEAIAPEQQEKAVAFLNEHAFKTPGFLVRPDVLLRLEADGAADRILGMQRGLLGSLMSEPRLKRMAEHVSRATDGEPYRPIDLITDLTDGIFAELDPEDAKPIDLYRRNLQRAYVDMLIEQVKADSNSSDLPALARGELRRLSETIGSGLSLAAINRDPTTLYHVQDLRDRIAQALDPRGGSLAGE